jgi:cytochrome P450
MQTNPIQLEDFDDDFNPFTALLTIGGEGKITDPWVTLAEVGKKTPVVEMDVHEYFGLPRQVTLAGVNKFYVVLGFEPCQEVMMKPTVYSNSIYEAQIGTTFGQSITAMDAPEHGKYRRLFQAAFTPKMLATLKPRFEMLVGNIVDGFAKDGKAELVKQLALHFPFTFICDLMNLPMEYRDRFHRLATAQTCVTFDRAHGEEAGEKLGRFLTGLIEERRKLKSDTDFVSIIANAEVEGERLPHEVLLGFFRQLMNAGGDTSYHGFSNTMAALFTNPDQLDAIRKDRSLIPQAIEEGLRWGAPTPLDRTATQDTVLAGVPIEKGALVRVLTGVANRDESIWPDPHKFNIFRQQMRHFAFGFGSHVCIGQHVARMELTTALTTLLDRLPDIRLDPDMPRPVIRGLTFRGADAVHVKWDVHQKTTH